MVKAMRPVPANADQFISLPSDPLWLISPKIDGDRVLGVAGARPEFLNRDGLPYSKPVPAGCADLLRELPQGLTLDGELEGGVWHLFDVVAGDPIEERLRLLRRVGDLVDDVLPVVVVPHLDGTLHRPILLGDWQREGGEGYVAKRAGSAYVSGKSPQWVKVKWLKQVDVIVIDRDVNSRANFVLGVIKDDQWPPVEVGHCSALTGDGPRIDIGDVVTVTVLQVTKNGRLREPVLPRLRTGEIHPADCTWENMMGAQRELQP